MATFPTLSASAQRQERPKTTRSQSRKAAGNPTLSASAPDKSDECLTLDEAWRELAAKDGRKALLVQLRSFVGRERDGSALHQSSTTKVQRLPVL